MVSYHSPHRTSTDTPAPTTTRSSPEPNYVSADTTWLFAARTRQAHGWRPLLDLQGLDLRLKPFDQHRLTREKNKQFLTRTQQRIDGHDPCNDERALKTPPSRHSLEVHPTPVNSYSFSAPPSIRFNQLLELVDRQTQRHRVAANFEQCSVSCDNDPATAFKISPRHP